MRNPVLFAAALITIGLIGMVVSLHSIHLTLKVLKENIVTEQYTRSLEKISSLSSTPLHRVLTDAVASQELFICDGSYNRFFVSYIGVRNDGATVIYIEKPQEIEPSTLETLR